MTVARCLAPDASGAGFGNGNHFSRALPRQADHPPAVIAAVALQRRAEGVVASDCCAADHQQGSGGKRQMAGLGSAGWLWRRAVCGGVGGAGLAPSPTPRPAATAPAGAVWIAAGAGRTSDDAGRNPRLAGGELPIRSGRVSAGAPVPGHVARQSRRTRANCGVVARIKP